jgi:hypothetical protein
MTGKRTMSQRLLNGVRDATYKIHTKRGIDEDLIDAQFITRPGKRKWQQRKQRHEAHESESILLT